MIWIIGGCIFASGAIIGWVAHGGWDDFCKSIDKSDWAGS